MNTPTRIAYTLTLAAVLALSSCSPSVSDASGVTCSPRDVAWTTDLPAEGFWLSVTSHVEANDATSRASTSTRFVIEADGQLRAAQGASADEDTFPPPIRRLTREQLAMIWSRLVALDVVRPRSKAHLEEVERALQQNAHFTRFVASAFSHQRSGIVLSSDPKAPEADQLVNQLSTWAWVAAPAIPPPPTTLPTMAK